MDAIIIVSETECKKKKKGKGRILIQRCLHDDQRALQSRKWQLIGKSQCCSAKCGHPIARVNIQLDSRYAASKHTNDPINHTRPSPCKHSPDVRGSKHPITAYYSIYQPRKDKRLSWPSWLTCSGRFTHISGHPSAAGRAQDRESYRPKTDVLPLCHATNCQCSVGTSGEHAL